MNLTDAVLPIVVIFIFCYALFKKVDVLKAFTDGALSGIQTVKKIAPTLILLITAVSMLRASGTVELICAFVSPLLSAVNFPKEVFPLALLKPFSGSGSVAMLRDILKTHGPDSFVGRVASVISGSTETTFYTVALYYGSINISKIKSTLLLALVADVTGFFMSVLLVKWFF